VDQQPGKEENAMTVMTPNAKGHERLSALASRYIDVASLPWVPTRFKGVELKVLMEDKETGLLTALTRFAPGATLPDHEHTELEQSYVLEGSLADDEGVATAGTTCGVRPAAGTTRTLPTAPSFSPSS
jgi:anti-sigma factor ChrR (cupin superfamily)